MSRWFIARAMAPLFPRHGDLPGVDECDLDGFLARFQRETTTLMWLGMILGALVFHLTPILTIYVPLPAFLLPKKLLDKHALGITTTRLYFLRQLVFVLKLGGGMCWGQDARVRAHFALPPYPQDPGTWRQA